MATVHFVWNQCQGNRDVCIHDDVSLPQRIRDSVDMIQLENMAGVSTNHHYCYLMYYLFKCVEVSHNTWALVSRLLESIPLDHLVNYTILIDTIIQMSMYRNIVQWICDFLHNRKQCVRLFTTSSSFVHIFRLSLCEYRIVVSSANNIKSSTFYANVKSFTWKIERA